MKKSIGILLYLVLMAVFLKFDLRLLINFRQFFLVVFGTALLLLPSLHEKDGKKQKLPETEREELPSRVKHFFQRERVRIGQNAVWAGILQTFVLLFLNMNTAERGISGMQTVALSCRPILYGFCIWIVLQDSGKAQKDAGSYGKQNKSGIESETGVEFLKTTVDYGQCLQNLGLTKREIEVALLAIQNESNAEIAEQLFISETTVKKHMSNIFSKLEIGQRQEIKEKCMHFSEEK